MCVYIYIYMKASNPHTSCAVTLVRASYVGRGTSRAPQAAFMRSLQPLHPYNYHSYCTV